ncbi:hypothetical protein GCM10011584_13180 [Nocardioides phosphati]|uniref:Uncharacterized protein n=1 Tax=Nocardioides phosphati TaxID=1867775 RepID=A0ABQ2N7X5_9ACTN|nr:hypothetical protein GCM10011584_13180 [Nocardioides phosphati]
MVALGAGVVLLLVSVDPAAAALLVDVELLGIRGSVGLAMTRDQLGLAWATIRTGPTVVQFAAGVRLVRAEPRSLLA